jgi:hypothetical protein
MILKRFDEHILQGMLYPIKAKHSLVFGTTRVLFVNVVKFQFYN